MAEDNKKWVEEVAAQVDVLNSIEKNFSVFAASLKERHAELQGAVPQIDAAVTDIQTTVQNAVRKSEKAAADIAAATERLSRDSGGDFAAWQKEAAKAKEAIEGAAGEIANNVKAVEELLTGVRDAVAELRDVESKFPQVQELINGVKDAVDRNTKAKVGDFAGAIEKTPAVHSEDVEKLRGEIAELKASLESAKTEILAAKVSASPTDEETAEKFNAGVVADELSEIKSIMFEMIRYMKIVGERKIEIPPVEVKQPELPSGSPEELAERMASSYRDLVKLMADKKNS